MCIQTMANTDLALEVLDTTVSSISAGKRSHQVNIDTELPIYSLSEHFSATFLFAQQQEFPTRAAEDSASGLSAARWSGCLPETHTGNLSFWGMYLLIWLYFKREATTCLQPKVTVRYPRLEE